MSVQNEAAQELIPVSTLPIAPPQPEWAAVYRFYDIDENLLYIGSTDYPPTRWSRHRTTQPWWPEVVAYSLEWWPDRAHAFAQEYKAIHAEAPRYNKQRQRASLVGELQPITEEVQRVFDAINDVEGIADPEARSRARAQITAKTRELSAKWQAERGELAHQMDADGESVRGIAKRLGIKPSTVQDLLRGYKGSGQNRPRTEGASDG